MDILDTLRFVRGAVSTKNFVPEMKHFAIENQRVRAFNGTLALSAPIAFDVDCAPLAVPMVSAIGNCDEAVSLSLTAANRLRIESGKFRGYINCLELADLPVQEPDGIEIEIDGEKLVAAFEKLLPFIGNDASRPWTNGILLRGQSAFATNNVCLVEFWLGAQQPYTANIPVAAVKEVLRIKSSPTHAQLSDHAITFHYENGQWVRTLLYSTEWPDLAKILDAKSNPEPIDQEIFSALEAIRPFVGSDGRVYFRDGRIWTDETDELGASFEVSGIHASGVYNLKMLALLGGVADSIDFAKYPEPLIFYGDGLRGAIIGQRL